MRREPAAVAQARIYLSVHPQLAISVLTRYEILRGLKAKRAASQVAKFEILCASLQILPLSEAMVIRGADIYADLHQRGQLIGDADILIAATAMENGLVLVTNNGSHHNRISGLTTANWLAP